MINNTSTQLFQTNSSRFAVAIAMAQAAFGLTKSIFALLLFWACPSMAPSLPEYHRMAVTAMMVERSTSRHSTMVAPSLSQVSLTLSSSTWVKRSQSVTIPLRNDERGQREEIRHVAHIAKAEMRPLTRRMSSSLRAAMTPFHLRRTLTAFVRHPSS
ncbi:uncharacterized protein BT62DRAFT_1007453 [Guyanagaster necrorhizus]|uniref:Uncharacterized protein n=1 Tax=Guyanagaster necrorhizus TaxID=856835 RepID=A0A9P7VSB5_9AGAR|nr:uncharacterized protein BT62DRAFT_1007453 [Guyanagaster necrorhizus MCA 3950]KAG7445079.1 hypothetical protein BT62DRAFT_1007453 [Guyanagaster necrorhizus MCA 3950]